MDKRETQEGLSSLQQQRLDAEKRELSFRNILTVKAMMEEARKAVYEGNELGRQGIAASLVVISIGFSVITRTNRMRAMLPRIESIRGPHPLIFDCFLAAVSFFGGLSMEQWTIENKIRPEEFKKYIKLRQYYDELKLRKTAGLPLSTKWKFVCESIWK